MEKICKGDVVIIDGIIGTVDYCANGIIGMKDCIGDWPIEEYVIKAAEAHVEKLTGDRKHDYLETWGGGDR